MAPVLSNSLVSCWRYCCYWAPPRSGGLLLPLRERLPNHFCAVLDDGGRDSQLWLAKTSGISGYRRRARRLGVEKCGVRRRCGPCRFSLRPQFAFQFTYNALRKVKSCFQTIALPTKTGEKLRPLHLASPDLLCSEQLTRPLVKTPGCNTIRSRINKRQNHQRPTRSVKDREEFSARLLKQRCPLFKRLTASPE